MKKILLCLLLVTGNIHAQVSDQTIIEAKARIAVKMKDPESVQFSNVVLADSKNGPVVCGWVNAKNSYGGYVGYAPFIVTNRSAELRGDGFSKINFNQTWNICYPPNDELFGTSSLDIPKINTDKYCQKVSQIPGMPQDYDCGKVENEAKTWLEEHKTSSLIALRCSRVIREQASYSRGKSCVANEEAEIIYSRGPKLDQNN